MDRLPENGAANLRIITIQHKTKNAAPKPTMIAFEFTAFASSSATLHLRAPQVEC